ncbi:uncharacterized protein LOC110112409 [Dendrobium catenatum]|uniref:uncharacterized protein LOC110112409 n=1 Tax=Dendrobium catenatum TaxID=906689 RepID=UPI0009F3DC49|nr:uncharacterized protein LOC110112409 [Dendrobium catenatum]
MHVTRTLNHAPLPAASRGVRAERQRPRGPQILEASDSEGEFEVFEQLEASESEEEIHHGRRRRPRDHDRYQGECRIKLDIPYFDGKLHIEDYLDWERAVENFFEYMEINPERQVKYVACRLKGGASAWWQQVLQTRRKEGRGIVRSWHRMKQLLRGHYLPTDYEQMLYMQYQHCSQGHHSVNEYTEEFYRLSARNNLNETTNQVVARYIGGLKEAIQDKLELNSVWTLSQAINYALKVELQLQRHSRSGSYRRISEHSADGTRQVQQNASQAIKPAVGMSGIGGPNSITSKVNDPKGLQKNRAPIRENPYAKATNIKCFRCFQMGHKSNECPSRPQLQLVDAEADEEEDDNEIEEENDFEEVTGDVGEPLICVMEKLLLAPKQPCTSQRNALFRTKCTIGGKVCDLLVDSGCTENVISRAVVHALKLKTTKNPNPYKISWVKKGVEMSVTDLCKVSFSIGKHYASEVLCDVLDMDVCHISLGRPWQYDVGAFYDCRANTYSFDWKGHRLRLIPNQSGQESNASKSKTALHSSSTTAMLNAWKESSSISALIVKEVAEGPAETNV